MRSISCRQTDATISPFWPPFAAHSPAQSLSSCKGSYLGGYQVLKKWLSYREHDILARPLRPEEVQHFSDTARRIAAILIAVSSGPD